MKGVTKLNSSATTPQASLKEDLQRHQSDGARVTENSPATREEKKAFSRRKILDAARDVFFRDGFMLANLDEVASRAGVAKGTLYRYFESKADLYVAVLAENGKAFTEKLQDVAAVERSAPESVRCLGAFYLEHWMRHREYFQIFWAVDNQSLIGGLPQEALDEVSRLFKSCLSILNGVLERGIANGEFRECETWDVANILWTLTNGLIQTETSSARRDLLRRPLQDVYADAVDLIIAGLARQPAGQA